MDMLLRNVVILDPFSKYHNKTKDIHVENGKIAAIGNDLNLLDVEQLDLKGKFLSPGFIDLFSHFNDPGMEQKETLETGADAALSGGYSQIFVLPNTKPVIDNKSFVEYVINKSKFLPIRVKPLGAATKQIEGKEIAEIYDMYKSGAVAFTDGLYPVQSAGLFLKILQYVKAFDGVLIQQPFETSIAAHGAMNEGIVSTKLGLPGIPAIGEEIFIQREIELIKYTGSKLHITGVSTARGAELLIKAKEEGLNITFSVTPHHLLFSEEELSEYDTNFKFNPPLRTIQDRDTLRKYVLEGKVDAIASHHFPQHWDNKTIEFEYAKNGTISLQTAYAAVQTAIPELNAEKISQLFSTNVAKIFGLNIAPIEENSEVDFTIFDPNGTTILTKENNKSKSSNSPFFGKELKGKIVGTFVRGQLHLN